LSACKSCPLGFSFGFSFGFGFGFGSLMDNARRFFIVLEVLFWLEDN
jgi:hypothetical protein